MSEEILPVHGFVLAGGKSARMGEDKALLLLGGRPMVARSLEKLQSFCARVSVAGSRDDLHAYAPAVHDLRPGQGPAAGIEAGLAAAEEEWALFVPVDVPLVPAALLRRWAAEVVQRECAASVLLVDGERQPAFCMVRRMCLPAVRAALDQGERRINRLLDALDTPPGRLWACDASSFAPGMAPEQVAAGFLNVNTPQDAAEAEAWAAKAGE